ncbi:uncharacterized protein [Gossypium hirsutum]|uniref:Uncharacterized protein n=1 Tax=Gossypium hirsutum TaxID=3635 RepID=A0A1U8P7S4_GOSHI|nr:uncharacterized protein LOC107955909 [Gossypium hirsutum]
MLESAALNGRRTRWQVLLSEFDMIYVNEKAVKGSTIADFLANRASEDYEPLKFDFSNEDIMYVATTEEDTPEDLPWKLNFDGASNVFEYEACIMKICAAIERKINVLEVFDDITFCYLLRDENQMADVLATLASMIRVNKREDMEPILMSIYKVLTHCYNIDEDKERDDYPWYHDILQYMKNREYPDQTTKNDRKTLRRLASECVLDGEIPYKRRKDQVPLRCVDAIEAKEILKEVHEVLPIEAEIPSLWVLSELRLDEAKWIQSRYDQLNLIEEKRLKAIRYGQMYQKRMTRAYKKKVRPRVFHGGDLRKWTIKAFPTQ